MSEEEQPYTGDIRIGGLMRCCIKSINSESPEHPREGDEMKCKYCASWVRYREEAWEWHSEKTGSGK